MNDFDALRPMQPRALAVQMIAAAPEPERCERWARELIAAGRQDHYYQSLIHLAQWSMNLPSDHPASASVLGYAAPMEIPAVLVALEGHADAHGPLMLAVRADVLALLFDVGATLRRDMTGLIPEDADLSLAFYRGLTFMTAHQEQGVAERFHRLLDAGLDAEQVALHLLDQARDREIPIASVEMFLGLEHPSLLGAMRSAFTRCGPVHDPAELGEVIDRYRARQVMIQKCPDAVMVMASP